MDSVAGPRAPDVVEIHFARRPRWRRHTVETSSTDLFTIKGVAGWFRKCDEGLSWRWPRT